MARTFRDVAIGESFSFDSAGIRHTADPHGYVKVSARGWTHPTYGRGLVGSIHAAVADALATDDPSSTPVDHATKYAHDLGTEHGRAAASWVNVDETTAETLRRGMDDGDPAVLDTLPAPDLSGQWADALTGPQLVADAIRAATEHGAIYSEQDANDAFGDLCDTYETAFDDAMTAVVEERIAYYLNAGCRACGWSGRPEMVKEERCPQCLAIMDGATD